MIARAVMCRPQLLREAIANQLAGEEYEALSSHVDSCDHCRHQLELLAGGSQWQSRVHECLSSSRVIALEDETEQRVASEDENDDTNDWQAFLEPSEDSAKLGRIGKYEIESLVGRGGFGVVFKALDPELNRYVAVKVLSSPLASSAAARKRFIREAQAAAAVVHDHVVPIHDVDTSRKAPFLVMPFFSGRSLQERLDQEGTLNVEEVLRIALQTARGLAAAHAQGLIHRDVKPANILLENCVERVRISDFGLARAVDDATQTQSGFIAGTPSYMAPEQARGESLDARADLFSLGSVMYAMCAGHPPFRAETTLAVLRRICDDDPRDVREHNPKIPLWLWEIIARLLSKSPSDRFQSADDIADLLEGWLAHVQRPDVVPAPLRTTSLPRKPASGGRNSPGVTVLLLTLASMLLLVLSVWFLPQFLRERPGGPVDDRDAQTQSHSPSSADKPSDSTPSRYPGLKPDQIQAELDLAWQETLRAEAYQPPSSAATRYVVEGELRWIELLLQRLEREVGIIHEKR